MTIKSTHNNITILGNIKSLTHHHDIIKELEIIKREYQNITIHILNSISITSSVIGYFCKLVDSEKINLSLHINNNDLYNLLDELNLINVLNVQKIS